MTSPANKAGALGELGMVSERSSSLESAGSTGKARQEAMGKIILGKISHREKVSLPMAWCLE